jgi:hypothetical protein
MYLFKFLTQEEEQEFRQSARDNYKIGSEIKAGLWHPVYTHECAEMNLENY